MIDVKFNHARVIKFSVDVVDRLLEVPGCNIHTEGDWGTTALHVAVIWNHREIVDRLLVNGANYYQSDHLHNNLLHHAVYYADEEMVRHVLSLNLNINEQNSDGETPLIAASIFKCNEMVKLLLENGADKTFKDKQEKQAIDYANKEIKEYLLS